jgi:hypothetical protein
MRPDIVPGAVADRDPHARCGEAVGERAADAAAPAGHHAHPSVMTIACRRTNG